jgi:hypothetical protein
MRSHLSRAAVAIAAPLIQGWLQSITFIRWATLEAHLGPLLGAAGLRDLELRGVGGMASMSVRKELLGALLRLELLILPIGLEIGDRVRLGLSLRDARLGRSPGLRGWLALLLARIWVRAQRKPLADLVCHLAVEHAGAVREGDVHWFDLSEVGHMRRLFELREKIPGGHLLPLDALVHCAGIHPEEAGVRLDLRPGPILRVATLVVQAAAPFARR